MIRPIALAGAHMECRRLKETIPVLTDLLAFEKVYEEPGSVTLNLGSVISDVTLSKATSTGNNQ